MDVLRSDENHLASLVEKLRAGALSRRDFVRLAALMGVSCGTAQLLASCGAPSTAVPPTATSVPPTVTPAAAGTGIAKQLITAELPEIDPGVATRAHASVITANCYDAVFRLDGWQRVNSLCEDYQYSSDNKTVRIKIREGVPFHDGTEMKASDVVFSLVRMLELEGPLFLLWKDVLEPEMVKVVDDYTFSVTTSTVYGSLLDSLAWVYVLNEKVVMQNVKDDDYGMDFLNHNDAGSGPFTIATDQPGERMILERFPDYWQGWGSTYLDGVSMEIVREPATRKLLMEQREGHLISLWDLDVDGHVALQAAGVTNLHEYSIPAVVCIMMNNQKYPTDNRDFRKACAYAFDYESVIQGLFLGRTDEVSGCIPKGFKHYKSFEDSEMLYRRDLDRARHHLQESGFDPGSQVLRYSARQGYPLHANLGLVLQSSLNEIGIQVEMEFVTGPQYFEMQSEPAKANNFNRISGRGLTSEPDQYCMEFFHSSSWKDKGWWATMQFYKVDRVDQLLDQARLSVDEAFRRSAFHEMQDIIYDDAPSIWTDQSRFMVSTAKTLQGFVGQPLGSTPHRYYPMYFQV